MLDKLLKAKAWHLFLIFFAIPMVSIVIFQAVVFGEIAKLNETNYDNENLDLFPTNLFFNFFSFIMVLSLIIGAIQLLWQREIGNRLQAYIPKELKLNTRLFNTAIAFQLFLLTVSILIFLFLIPKIKNFFNDATMASPEELEMNYNPFLTDATEWAVWLMPIFFILIFVNVFVAIYCYYFCAKTLTTAESQRKTEFSDYIGYILGFWYVIIGVWIIQPIVHKIINREENNQVEKDIL